MLEVCKFSGMLWVGKMFFAKGIGFKLSYLTQCPWSGQIFGLLFEVKVTLNLAYFM